MSSSRVSDSEFVLSFIRSSAGMLRLSVTQGGNTTELCEDGLLR